MRIQLVVHALDKNELAARDDCMHLLDADENATAHGQRQDDWSTTAAGVVEKHHVTAHELEALHETHPCDSSLCVLALLIEHKHFVRGIIVKQARAQSTSLQALLQILHSLLRAASSPIPREMS